MIYYREIIKLQNSTQMSRCRFKNLTKRKEGRDYFIPFQLFISQRDSFIGGRIVIDRFSECVKSNSIGLVHDKSVSEFVPVLSPYSLSVFRVSRVVQSQTLNKM